MSRSGRAAAGFLVRASSAGPVAVLVAAALVFAAVLATAAPAVGSSEGSEPRPNPGAAAAFADRVLPRQLREQAIPGAALAIVTGEDTLLRGYGEADVRTGRPVDPARTVFVPASVAKLITTTAVMQLVEDGRLELDEDVNRYLRRFRIEPGDFPDRPITVEHLLTHTAGFAGGDLGTAAATPADVHDLGAHLEEHEPDRIRPPGTRAVYSNYGMALAGFLVEERTGIPFERYVERHILRPLGMDSTTFVQPMPSIERRLATGYLVGDGPPVPTAAANFGHMPPHGAGFRSTAADMAKFLRAHLDDGGAILRTESARLIRERHFGNADGTAGMAYGFWEYEHGGHRVLVHRGSVPGYLAVFAMLPERRIGIYASYNANGRDGGTAAWDLVNAFVDEFAGPAGAESGDDGLAGHGSRAVEPLPSPERFTGTYGLVQVRDSGDLGRLQALTGGVSVGVDGSGLLTTKGPVTHLDAGEQRWVQVEPGLFREQQGRRTIRFGDDGLLAAENPAGPFQKLAWYENPAVHLATLLVSILLLLGSALLWPVLRTRRHRGKALPRWSRPAEASAWLTAILVLGSVASVIAMFANFEQNQAGYFRGTSPLLSAVLLLPKVAAIGFLVALVASVLSWFRGWWGGGRTAATRRGGVGQRNVPRPRRVLPPARMSPVTRPVSGPIGPVMPR